MDVRLYGLVVPWVLIGGWAGSLYMNTRAAYEYEYDWHTLRTGKPMHVAVPWWMGMWFALLCCIGGLVSAAWCLRARKHWQRELAVLKLGGDS